MNGFGPGFAPELRKGIVRQDIDLEAVAWSPAHPRPVALDPMARAILDMIDGRASLQDLADDVHEVVGVERAVAYEQVRRCLATFADAGMLTSSAVQPDVLRTSPFISPMSSCMEASSCTGRVTSLNLELHGHRLRLAFGSHRLARRMRAVMRDHAIDEVAPLAFFLRNPNRRDRHYRLVDRGGFLLGTARRSASALAMLGDHLTALTPVADGFVRLRLRSAISEDGATLFAWPLLYVPELDEAGIRSAGYHVVHRIVVDLRVEDGRLAVPTADRSMSLAAVQRIVVPAPAHVGAPSPAQVAALLADQSVSDDRAAVLSVVASVVQNGTEVATADPRASESLLRALRSLD